MHWLEKWRMDYTGPRGRKGCTREELAAMVSKRMSDEGISCSPLLIAYLEDGEITHPGIADIIAEVTGATIEQRDSLVHKKHHGTWEPKKKGSRKK